VVFSRRPSVRCFFAALLSSIAIVLGGAPSSAQNAYITNNGDNKVSVIATATNTVVGAPIPVGGEGPAGVVVTPDGSKVYVANERNNTVSVIATATNTVIGTIPVGRFPFGIDVTPDGSKVYVVNGGDNTVSVIATVTNTVSTTPVGQIPIAFGIFIPKPTKLRILAKMGDGKASPPSRVPSRTKDYA
jgi:YVTN family beta-propeller protein